MKKNISVRERKHGAINHGRNKGKRLFIYFISMNSKSKEMIINNNFKTLNQDEELVECDEIISELSTFYKGITSLSEIENQISNGRAGSIFKEFNTILLNKSYPIKLSNKLEEEFDISIDRLLEIIRNDRELYKSLLLLFIKISIRNEIAKLIKDLESECLEHNINLDLLNYDKYIKNIGIK